MTLNIKIADKMCSKGKIKFCVKELKLEKRLMISFWDLVELLILYHGLLTFKYWYDTHRYNYTLISRVSIYRMRKLQFNDSLLRLYHHGRIILRNKERFREMRSCHHLFSEKSNWNIASEQILIILGA